MHMITKYITLFCLLFIVIQFIRNPQQSKERFGQAGFLFKELWKRRKTSKAYRNVACLWLIYVALVWFVHLVASGVINSQYGWVKILAILAGLSLPVLPIIVIIYAARKTYVVSKIILDQKGHSVESGQKIFYPLYDFVFLLLLFSPYYLHYLVK